MTTQLAMDWSTPTETSRAQAALATVRPAAAPEMESAPLLDRRGLPRPVSTLPGYRKGSIPASKGRRYPPDPVTPEDVDTLLKYLSAPRSKHETRHGATSRLRLCALITLLWRSGLRISEALDLEHRDLNHREMCITVRCGKNGKRRISAMDEWAWAGIQPWLDLRTTFPAGPVFCVVSGVTAVQRWTASDVRRQLSRAAKAAGITRRVAPHQFRHAHAVDLWRDGIDVFVVQRQLGHQRLDVTALYLSSVAPVELLEPIGRRRPPLMPVSHASANGGSRG
jgi:site-specific recombinase XerD